MIDIIASSKCAIAGCGNPPFAAYTTTTAAAAAAATTQAPRYYCTTHYPDDAALDDTTRTCQLHELGKGTFICADCKTRSHKKEWTVICELQRKINLKPVAIDRRIDAAVDSACRTARRPDVLYVTLFRIVLVEIDENQHADRDSSCECSRLSELASAFASGFGILPVVVIRYNPDKFAIGGGGAAAAVTVGRKRAREEGPSREERLERLVSVVKRELNRPPPSDDDAGGGTGYSFRLIQLFFDTFPFSSGGGGGGGGGSGSGVKFTDDGFEAEEDITRRIVDPCA
jgi:uncharacterized protein YlaI